MNLKNLAIFIVFLVFILPGLVGIIVTSIKSTVDPSPKNIGESVEEVAKQSIPWWVGVMVWLAKLPSELAAIIILGFMFFLIWIGAFK
jgi:hypothetical protein